MIMHDFPLPRLNF